MSFWQWSKTAATNSTADSSINWQEGMSPSSVNDSARAMMARTAEWRDDISGLLLTGGTSTAYTVTTNQGGIVPNNGDMIAFTASATNGLNPTLAVDGGTAFQIRADPNIVGLPAGTLVVGSPYTVRFNSGVNAWLLRDFYGAPLVVPLGGIIIYTGTTSPNSNFVFPNGQAISRTTYAAYFALVGTTYGVGDGSTTFNVPDLRERLAGFLGTMGGAGSPGRITTAGSGVDGSTLGASGGAQNVTLVTANLPAYTPSGTNTASNVSISNQVGGVWVAQPGGTQINGAGSGMQLATLFGTAAAQTFTGNAQGGTSTPVNEMPPVLVLTALLRIN